MNQIIFGAVVAALFVAAGCASDESKNAAKSSEKPSQVLGLEPGWELAQKGNYSAVQKGGKVTVKAVGDSPTAGYHVKLVQSPLKIWPPEWLLAAKKPDGMAAQMITPFEAEASFNADDPVDAVRVTDARGALYVAVTRD